ncbi:MAG: hypothetical protein KAY24_13940 [Candidatus Eisenbacteria sp.]|nr:hypothetical protein [Candidatus Eisenbacteria bacterium]
MTLPDREEMERALRQVKGVEGARVRVQDGEVSEIHVVAVPGSRAKNVARDVRSFLAAMLGVEVSHQKISVAVREERAPFGRGHAIGATPWAPSSHVAGDQRILFRSVNLLVEGLRSEVQVELTANGRPLLGGATGVPASLGTERLVVAATLDALGELVTEDVRLFPGDLIFPRVGGGEAVIAEVVVVRPRSEQRLIGACGVGQDRHRSVVFAVLDAINRIVSRLVTERWVEFEVKPEQTA